MAGPALLALLAGATPALADVNVTVNPGQTWLGFINVFELPSNGGGYVFGSPWGTADLTATFTGPVLRLGPNTINDPSPFWYTPQGGPGASGNKIIDASMYVEPAGSLPGQNVTFSGIVLSNTLTSAHTSVAFIKDFAPDFSSFNVINIPLTPGPFSITLATVADPARHVQYGFETIGACVWATDVGPYGNVQVTAIPSPGAMGLLSLGGIAALRRRRR
jgi:MYXO-CTERM domain-containing protein